MPAKFVLKKDKGGKFRFNLLATNGQVIASSEAYNTKIAANNGISSVKKNAAGATVVDSTLAAPAAKKAAPARKAAVKKAAPAKKAVPAKAAAKKVVAKKAPAKAAAKMFAPGGVAAVLMLNLRLAQRGGLRPLLGHYLALGVTAALALLGVAAQIEMLYRLQLSAALGPELTFLGLTLDASRGVSWVGALGLMLTGLGLFERSRRQFVRQWAQIQQRIEPDAPHREAA